MNDIYIYHSYIYVAIGGVAYFPSHMCRVRQSRFYPTLEDPRSPPWCHQGPRRRGSRAGVAARTQPKPNRTESPLGSVGTGNRWDWKRGVF